MSGTQGEPPLARLTSYPSPLASHYLSPMSTLAPRADCAHLTRGPATPMPRLWVVLGLTGTFMVLEAIGGWLSGSLALLADAGHMLTDVGALGLTLVTAWIAQRPADDTKTYGYLRWEILAALVNGAALFMIAGWVVVEAVQRIHHPVPIRTGLFLAVAAAGLVVNLVSLRLLHGSREGSLNARGAYLHVMSDALGSVAALGGGCDHLADRMDAGRSDRLDRCCRC